MPASVTPSLPVSPRASPTGPVATSGPLQPAGALAPAPASALLELHAIQAGYGRSTVLDGISLAVPQGSRLAILGRNGMGKTTLLTTLMGLTRLHGGTICLDDRDISRLPPWRRAAAGLGWVPQERAIFAPLSVEENLTLTARGGAWTLERIYTFFPRLAERRRNMGNQLSGGEQQMLAIARALMLNPRVLLMDEPLEGLAPRVAQEVLDTLERLVADAGMTTLIVEQHAGQILPMADHAIILELGRIVWHGPAATLLEDSRAMERWLGVTDSDARLDTI